MSDTVRNDIFFINSRTHAGYYQLRKDKVKGSKFLPELLIVSESTDEPMGITHVVDPTLYKIIADGDIASVSSSGKLRVLLSRKANHNTVLITERCNNLCLFCSQPPKEGNDDWLLGQAMLGLADFGFDGVIGVSGGEPLLYGQKFIDFLDFIAEYSPTTSLHVLTNGRAFCDFQFTKEIAARSSKLSISFGIPLYSASAETHDLLVGAEGAFSETVKGIINAGNMGLNMEIRFIPTQKNFQDLSSVIEYCNRVFSNINQISVMNLEPMGWARKNWDELYISPINYAEHIQKSVRLSKFGSTPLVFFNYPLCHLEQSVWDYTVKSISDWKNHYPAECKGCRLIDSCGGYFSSAEGKFLDQPRRII